MKHTQTLITILALFSINSVFADKAPNLDDPKVLEKILKEAVLKNTLIEKPGPHVGLRLYEAGKQFPFTGWIKDNFKQGQDQMTVIWGYKGGEVSGPFRKLYPNGKKAEEGVYARGKLEGALTMWHKNGKKKRQAKYVGGIVVGVSTNWHPNGQKADEGPYKDGKVNGKWTMWYSSGEKASEANYKNGKLEGPATIWDKKGRVRKQTRFKNGVEIKE